MHGPGARRSTWIGARARLALLFVFALAAALAASPGRSEAQTPDEAFLDRVVASLSVNERVGQLVMVNFVGDDVSATSDVATLIRDYQRRLRARHRQQRQRRQSRRHRDRRSQRSRTGCSSARSRRARATTVLTEYFLPLFVATDNEGDLFPFTNVTNGYTAIPNNMTIGATWSKDASRDHRRHRGQRAVARRASTCCSAPSSTCSRIPRSGGNGDIGIRSFGGNPTWVGELGRAYVRGVHAGSDGRMLTVAKHFPGHGGSDRSTDSEVPTVNKSLAQLRASDLAPFAEVDRQSDDDPAGVTDAHDGVAHPLPELRRRCDRAVHRPDLARCAGLQHAHGAAGVRRLARGTPRDERLARRPGGQEVVRSSRKVRPNSPTAPSSATRCMAGNDLLPLVEFYKDAAHPGWKDYQLPVIEDSILYMREQYAQDPDFRRRADDAVRHVIAAKLKLYPQLQLSPGARSTPAPAADAAATGGGRDACAGRRTR